MLFGKKEDASGNVVDDKQRLLRMSEISLILDTYDDIFSDFDPRPYSVRALSDDFLQEVKRATRDRPSGNVEIKFMMPHHTRNLVSENLIKRRLKEHFKRHYLLLVDEAGKSKRRSLFTAFIGLIFLLLGVGLTFMGIPEKILSFLLIIVEPAGWFFAWTGLEAYFGLKKEMGNDLTFYEKMSQAEINFLPY